MLREIQTIDYEWPGHTAAIKSWARLFLFVQNTTNTQVDGNRCWLFIYSFLHFSHLYKVDTQSFFIHLKLLISDRLSPDQASSPGKQWSWNVTQPWVDPLWSLAFGHLKGSKDGLPKTHQPSFAPWLRDLNAFYKTLTDAQLSQSKWSLTLIVVTCEEI